MGTRTASRLLALAVGMAVARGGAALAADLSGWWYVRDTVRGSDYHRFVGLELGYRIRLEQDGAWIFGSGEKTCEDGHALPSRRRTPIGLAGTVDGDRVTLRLVEDGLRRTTSGAFTWTVVDGGRAVEGTFSATAGNSHGVTVAKRRDAKPPPCED